jgi:hypothetical protein
MWLSAKRFATSQLSPGQPRAGRVAIVHVRLTNRGTAIGGTSVGGNCRGPWTSEGTQTWIPPCRPPACTTITAGDHQTGNRVIVTTAQCNQLNHILTVT